MSDRFFFLLFGGLGFERRTSALYHLNHTSSPAHLALVILEMESLKLFAWAGLEP
jgi:hypothetical protein